MKTHKSEDPSVADPERDNIKNIKKDSMKSQFIFIEQRVARVSRSPPLGGFGWVLLRPSRKSQQFYSS